MITDHYNKYNNNEKLERMWELPKCDTENTKWENAVGKIDFLDAGLHKPSICEKHNICKHNKGKCSKTRYACTEHLRSVWQYYMIWLMWN